MKMIMACDTFFGIGYNDRIPWHNTGDLQNFRKLTLYHDILMGRKTADHLTGPLSDRRNLVLTNDFHWKREGFETVHNLSKLKPNTWIIGGAKIFSMLEILCSDLYITIITGQYQCDTWHRPNFKHWILNSLPVQAENCTFYHYVRSET